jgi:hypothetical protein
VGGRLDGNLVRPGHDVEDCALNQEVLVDMASISRYGWCHKWIAQECCEMIICDPPDVDKNDHKRRETDLGLILVFTFQNCRPFIESIQDISFVRDHDGG